MDDVMEPQEFSEGILGTVEEEPIETPEIEPEPPEQLEQEPEDEEAKAKSLQQQRDKTKTAVTKYLRELRANEELKEISDVLNKSYFRDQEYQNLGPVQELRDLKNEIELLGGVEGLRHARDMSFAVEAIDKMVDEGNPQVIQDMASESPEGFKKLVPTALDELRKLDATAFANVMKPHVVQALSSTGLDQRISSAMSLAQRAYQSQDDIHVKFYLEKAFEELTGVSQWLEGLSSQANEHQETHEVRQEQQYQEPSVDIQQQLIPWAEKEFRDALKPFLNGRKLSDDAVRDLIQGVASEVDTRLAGDQAFQDNFKAWKMSGRADKILAQAKYGINSVKAAAARAVFERRYGNQPVKAQVQPQVQHQATKQAAKSQTGVVEIPRKPNMTDIDWNRDPEKVLYLTHKAYLRDGRLVHWK